MVTTNKKYPIDSVEAIDSPALLVFPNILEQNIINAAAIAHTGQNALRPHIKTVKCKEPIAICMRHGIFKYKCSTISEAEMLGEAGAEDVLMSYQLSKPKAQRFKELNHKFPNTLFSSLIDNFESAKLLSEVFADSFATTFIDINLGMDRTGIKINEALRLFDRARKLPNLEILGFHCYEGHISTSDPTVRKTLAEEAFAKMDLLRAEAEQCIDKQLKLVMGGSPTFSFYANKARIDCTPGTIFFWDSGYGDLYAELPFTPAAVLLTRIISIIDEHKLCLDLGYKSVASDPPLPRITFTDMVDYKVVGHYEEHMVVEVPTTLKYNVGEPFMAIPIHICPTVNLYEELIPIINGKKEQSWKVVARNRKISI